MTLTSLVTERPLAQQVPAALPRPEPTDDAPVKTKQFVIINWSGDLDKIWPTLILSSTAAASGMAVKVFITYWGLLPFVKEDRRIVGHNWMQKMLAFMQRPGITHVKLTKMNFFGMGPWMMGKLARQNNVASPKELLEAALALGVEFVPCQMTMDMFGLTRDDMIDGLGEPAGAATAIELMTNAEASLFI